MLCRSTQHIFGSRSRWYPVTGTLSGRRAPLLPQTHTFLPKGTGRGTCQHPPHPKPPPPPAPRGSSGRPMNGDQAPRPRGVYLQKCTRVALDWNENRFHCPAPSALRLHKHA